MLYFVEDYFQKQSFTVMFVGTRDLLAVPTFDARESKRLVTARICRQSAVICKNRKLLPILRRLLDFAFISAMAKILEGAIIGRRCISLLLNVFTEHSVLCFASPR